MTKLFLISNMYPSENFPSFGVFVQNFEKSFESEGGLITHRVVIDTILKNPIAKILQYFRYYLNIFYVGIFKRYDFIYVHYIAHNAIPVLLLNIFFKKRVIVNIHGDDILARTRFVKFLQHFVDKLLLRSELIIVPSQFFKEVIQERGLDIKNKIFISPSGGINLNIFNNKVSPFKNPEKDSILIGYVSRIDKGKGWLLFLELLAKLLKDGINIKGIIVGDGAEKVVFTEKIKELELLDKTMVLSSLPHDQLSSVYRSMDLFIFPTILKESLGLVGIEAMACGIPVLGSRIGGLKSFLREGYNGFLFEPNDLDDLYSKAVLYFELPEAEKQVMIKNCIETANSYEADLVSGELYNRIAIIGKKKRV